MPAFATATKRLTGALVAVPLVVLGLAAPAAAATVTDSPTPSWTPWKACNTGQTADTPNCAQVRSIVTLPGDRVALAGDFTQLRSGTGQSVTVNNLAVIQKSTGQLDPAFAKHTWNGTVFSLETDGTSLYVAGTFSKIDGSGTGAGHVAKLNATTGAKSNTFKTGVTGNVYGTELKDGKLYLGGNFTAVQTQPRGRLARIDATTGTVDPAWTPSAEMAPASTGANTATHNTIAVRDIETSSDGSRVYVAGDFDVVNGVAGISTITALDNATGAFATGWTQSDRLLTDWGFQGMSIAVVDGSTPGIVLAGGGKTNRAWRLNLDGSINWSLQGDGDFQAVAVSGGTVYFGGHFTCVSAKDCYDKNADGTWNMTGDAVRPAIAAVQYTPSGDGRWTNGNPLADPTWAPVLGPVNYATRSLVTPYYYGVWSLHVGADGDLYAGGVFGNVNVGGTTYKQPKYVAFDALATSASR